MGRGVGAAAARTQIIPMPTLRAVAAGVACFTGYAFAILQFLRENIFAKIHSCVR
jgi:hypothetical protein